MNEVKLIDLELEIPSIFKEVYTIMKSLEPKNSFTVIAGGSLCNLYMGKPFRDIDIFIDYEVDERKLRAAFNEDIDVDIKEIYQRYSGWIEIPAHFKIVYKGYQIDIVPSYRDRVLDFDFRFRQFYYLGKKVIASQEAIQDINDKQLVIVNPKSCYSTLIRMFRFQEEFGFTTPKQSISFLTWTMSQMKCTREELMKRLDNSNSRASDGVKQAVKSFIDHRKGKDEKFLFKGSHFPFDISVKDRVLGMLQDENYMSMFGLTYKYLTSPNPIPKKTFFTLSITYEHLRPAIEKVHRIACSLRLKALFNPRWKQIPFVSGKKLEEQWINYLQTDFVNDHVDLTFASNLQSPRVGDFDVTIEDFEDNLIHHLDYFQENIKVLHVGEFKYFLRKCSNGKYTISSIMDKDIIDGSGFYLGAIGLALKEQYPDQFDFHNPDLKGVFGYSSQGRHDEHFFSERADKSYLTYRKLQTKVPILLRVE